MGRGRFALMLLQTPVKIQRGKVESRGVGQASDKRSSRDRLAERRPAEHQAGRRSAVLRLEA
jgi:hypothetical protein